MDDGFSLGEQAFSMGADCWISINCWRWRLRGAQRLTAIILKVISGGHIGKALFEVSGLVAMGKLGVSFE